MATAIIKCCLLLLSIRVKLPVLTYSLALILPTDSGTIRQCWPLEHYVFHSVSDLITINFIFRTALVLATILHEWAHVAAACVLGHRHSAINSLNMLGGVSSSDWINCLNPLQPISSKFSPHVTINDCNLSKTATSRYWQSFIIQISGWLASACICAMAWTFLYTSANSDNILVSAYKNEIFLGILCSFAGSTATDIFGWNPHGKSSNSYCCGNFGLLLSGGASRLRAKAIDAMGVLESMAAVSTERGGQSGGLVTFQCGSNGSGVRGVRVRICPSKRQSLSHVLTTRFSRACTIAALWDWICSCFSWMLPREPSRNAVASGKQPRLYAGHTRFATSSIPSPVETHPHQWTPEYSSLVFRVDPLTGRMSSKQERMGVYLTHNGDFEFWNLFGRDRTHAEMGLWLSQVHGRRAPAECDSVMIAGLLELLRTQGMWMPSLRLAFQQVVVMSYEEVVVPEPDAPEGAPPRRSFLALAAMAEKAFEEVAKEREEVKTGETNEHSLRDFLGKEGLHKLETAIIATFRAQASNFAVVLGDLTDTSLQMFACQSVANFLDNDMFWSVKKFLAFAKGSFGMAASCTVEADRTVLAALNQPLSVGLAPHHGAILYSSESHALKVALNHKPSSGGTTMQSQGEEENHISFRFDLDEADGEILELVLLKEVPQDGKLKGEEGSFLEMVENGGAQAGRDSEEGHQPVSIPFVLTEAPFVRFRLHNNKRNCAVTMDDVKASNRLVEFKGNQFVSMASPAPQTDLVGHDIQDIPRVLAVIRSDWSGEHSLNRQSSAAMYSMLAELALSRVAEAAECGSRVREIDVLVVGVENSLWVGEQFAADLQNLLPQLRVVPVSANKVIGVMGNARGAISTAGFSFCKISTALTSRSIVLCISQSGQTFPTLHATRILMKQCPGRVFVCVGMMDSKMSGAVGQSFSTASPFSARIFCTHAGWRSAEAASLSVVAAHATLTELMLFLSRQLRLASSTVNANSKMGHAPLGLRLSLADIVDMQRMRDSFVDQSSVDIVGSTVQGVRVKSTTHEQLQSQGSKWAMHVLETPIAWAMSAIYIFVTVVLGVPIFTDIRRALPWGSNTGEDVAAYFAHALDALLYIFLPVICALILRIFTGRELLARIGMRTVVIADIPYVHQMLEIYVSKLFSLSYWIASVEVHGANPIDHFVHRFTHRVKRGVLLAVGRPDGRLCSQTKCESWVLMAVLQARSIVSLGSGAEAITIGHNPHSSGVIKRHIVLPSHRPQFLCEKLLGVDDLEPMKRMASRKHAVTHVGGQANGLSKFDVLDSNVVGAHLCLEGSLVRARRQGLLMLAHGRSEIDAEEMEDPVARLQLLSAMDVDVQKVLESQSAMEELTENRFASLERLIAFQVLFHSMASTVASLWPLQFATWRSQSCLRIATTAAPVSAADLEREWLDSLTDTSHHHLLSRDVTVHRRGQLGSNSGSRGGSLKSLADWIGGSGKGGGRGGGGGGGSLHGSKILGMLSFPRSQSMDSIGAREGSTHHRQQYRRRRTSRDETPGSSMYGGMSFSSSGFVGGSPGQSGGGSHEAGSHVTCGEASGPHVEGMVGHVLEGQQSWNGETGEGSKHGGHGGSSSGSRIELPSPGGRVKGAQKLLHILTVQEEDVGAGREPLVGGDDRREE